VYAIPHWLPIVSIMLLIVSLNVIYVWGLSLARLLIV